MKRNAKISTKRMLSLVLALCMLLSLVPAGSVASAVEELAVFNYNPHKLQYGQWSKDVTEPKNVTSYAMTMAGNSQEVGGWSGAGLRVAPFADNTTSPFKYYGISTGVNAKWWTSETTHPWTFQGDVGDWAAYSFLMPNDGTYAVKLAATELSGACIVNVYVAPINAANKRDEQYKLATVNTLGGASGAPKFFDLGNRTLSAGEYVATFEIAGSTSGQYLLFGGGLQFASSATKKVLTLGVNNGQKVTLTKGQDTTLDVAASINETATSLTSATGFVAEGVKSGIVSAKMESGKLVLTGVDTGETSLNVRMIVNGVMGWVEIPVEVKLGEGVKELKFEVSDEATTPVLGVGGTREIPVAALINDQSANIGEATALSVTSKNANVATARIVKRTDGKSATLTFTGVGQGTADLEIAGTLEGVSATKTVSVSVGTEEKVYAYNFMRLQYGQWSTDGYAPSQQTAWGWEKTAGNYFERTTDPFIYGGNTSSSFAWSSSSASYGPELGGSIGQWAAYQIRVQDAGYYIPKIEHTKWSSSAIFDVYLAPASVTNPRDAHWKIGTFDAYTMGLLTNQVATFDPVAIASGDYILSFYIAGKNPAAVAGPTADTVTFISKVTLNQQNGSWLDLRADEMNVVMFAQAKTNITALLAGTGVDLKTVTALTAESKNPAIATAYVVRSEDKSTAELVAEGVYSGSTAAYVSAATDSARGAVCVPINVTWKPDYKKTELFVEKTTGLTALVNQTAQTTAQLKFNGEYVSFQDAEEVTIVSDDAKIASAALTYSEDGKTATVTFTGQGPGETQLTLRAVYDGTAAEVKIPFVTTSKTYFYNLWKVKWGQWSNEGYPLSYVDTFAKTTKGDPQEIKCYFGYESDPWMYDSVGEGFNAEWTSSSASYGVYCTGTPGSYLRLKIRVPVSGIFNVQSYHSLMPSGLDADVFIAPDGSSEPMADYYRVGTIRSYKSQITENITQELGNVTLKKGDYYLTYKIIGKDDLSSGTDIWPGGIKLKTLRELTTLLTSSSTNEIMMEGSQKELSITALDEKTGLSIDLSKFRSLTVSSNNEAAATATIDPATGKLAVSAHSAGSALLTVVGITESGDETPVSIAVQTVPAETFNYVTMTAENASVAAGGTTQLTATAYRIDNQVIANSEMSIFYKSSDTGIALVDSNGKVTARNAGTATITVFMTKDGITRSADVDITVVGFQKIKSVVLNGTALLAVGGRENLAVVARLADGVELNLTTSGATVLYEIIGSDPTGAATIGATTGQLRGMKRGTIQVQATVTLGEDVVKSQVKTIRVAAKTDPAEFSKIVLSADRTQLAIGESAQLKAGALLKDGTYQYWTEMFQDAASAGNTVEFINQNPEVISVDDTGIIRALTVGDAVLNLKAVVKGVTYEKQLTISVTNAKLKSATVSVEKSPIFVGDASPIIVLASLDNGRMGKASDLTLAYTTADPAVGIVEDGKFVAKGIGTTDLTVTATLNGVSVIVIIPVKVEDDTLASITATAAATTIKPTSEGTKISVTGKTLSGLDLVSERMTITYESKNPDIVTVNETGWITPVKNGKASVLVTAEYKGIKKTATVEILIKDGKTESTYFTPERRAAAKKNYETYPWAKEQAERTITAADLYLAKGEDYWWNLVTTQDLPRAANAWGRWDPDIYNCPYCDTNLVGYTGDWYSWKIDVFNNPWKIQCPKCRRRLPSNDFGKFYEAGLNEHGFWDYDKAKAEGSQYLTNDLYPEKDEELGVTGWGVDDGWGYVRPDTYQMLLGYGEQHRRNTAIAYYNHWGLWYTGGYIGAAMSYLSYAYVYTGDIKYGRAGAILMDRISDVYPSMYTAAHSPTMGHSDHNAMKGRVIGEIWETGLTQNYAKYADAVFPAMNDPAVVEFLSKKAIQYKLDEPRAANGKDGGVGNPKTSGDQIWQNVENGFLREVIKAVRVEKTIYGNEGMHQSSATTAAVVLDSMPDTKDTLDWVLGGGGKVLSVMAGTVDRDGHGTEGSPGYASTWISSYSSIVEMLNIYKGYEGANLYQHPKYVKLLKCNFPLTLSRRATVQIGDTGNCGGPGFSMSQGALIDLFLNTGDVETAQMIYFLNGNSTKGLVGSIFVDSSKLGPQIQAVIDQYGEYDFDQSTHLTGFGAAILRGGSYHEDLVATKTVDTQRDFWMNWSNTAGHGNPNALNLGLEAYGVNMAPTFGYPESTSGTPRMVNWDDNTIRNNTVVVNQSKQKEAWARLGKSYHFNDSGRVKVMDAAAPAVYSTLGVSEYRRTVVMVDASEDVSYGIDFFRVTGGNDHMYSFHAMSDTVSETENLNLVAQSMGTYAGPTVEFGDYKLSNGYDGFRDVRRAASPGNEFAVDFKINDFHKVLKTPRDLHLRVTMLNDFDVDEVALAKGEPPTKETNPKSLEYILVNRKGTGLDSLFTTVFEPYDTNRYVAKLEQVTIDRSGGAAETATDVAKAVKVTLTNGRVDYVVYATNNAVQYQVDGLFEFKGFVGVYTMKAGIPVYSYLNDGSLIGDDTGTAAYTGKILNFTTGLSFNNSITISVDQACDVSQMIDQYIYSGSNGAAYRIKDATRKADGTVVLDIGDFTLVNAVKDPANPVTGGYTYDIGAGAAYRIPIANVNDDSPVFDPIKDQVTNVGSVLNVPFNAVAPSGAPVTYQLGNAPDGAIIDPATKTFTWSPSGSQVGTHHVSIIAKTGGLETAIHFQVKVYPNTTGGGSSGSEDKFISLGGNVYQDAKDGTLFSAGPDQKPDTTDDIQGVVKGADGKYYIGNADGTYRAAGKDGFLGTGDDLYYEVGTDGKIGTSDDVLIDRNDEQSANKFIDLGNYEWAKDAIGRLTEKGIIKGTSEDTFSPGRDISRADFAVLVVRALELKSDLKGEFSDVKSGDYYYNEVRIAQALGIVQGSNGTFRPGDSITREDMMVMLARALDLAKGTATDLETFLDTGEISDYALEAVATLVKSGLITGSNGKINPKGNASRAEVAVLLDRLLGKSGTISQ